MKEHEKKTIIKNLKWMTISKIIVYLLSIVTITLIPRYLGVEGYGQLNFIISFVGLFAIIGDLGLQTLITRNISKNPKKANEYYNGLFLFRIFISVLFLVVVGIFAIILHTTPTTNHLIIYSLGISFALLANFNLSFLIAFQEIKYQAISDVLQKLTYTILTIVVIIFNYKLFGVIIASALSYLVLCLYVFIIIRKHITFKKLKINKEYIKQKLIQSTPFIFTAIFWTIYFSIDRVFITYLKGNYSTGLYSISYTFIGFLISIMIIIHTTLFPVISKFSKNNDKLKNIVNKYLLLIYLFSIPTTIGGIYLAPQIITLVFGAQYLGGTTAFRLIMLFFLLYSIDIIHYNLLIINHFEKYSLKLLGLASVVNIIFNFLFIPLFGIIGAAITTIISEMIIFVGSYTKIKNQIIKIDYLKPIILVVVAGFIMLISLVIFNALFPAGILQNKFDVLITIAVGGLIYTFILIITKAIDLKQIKEMLKN